MYDIKEIHEDANKVMELANKFNETFPSEEGINEHLNLAIMAGLKTAYNKGRQL